MLQIILVYMARFELSSETDKYLLATLSSQGKKLEHMIELVPSFFKKPEFVNYRKLGLQISPSSPDIPRLLFEKKTWRSRGWLLKFPPNGRASEINLVDLNLG